MVTGATNRISEVTITKIKELSKQVRELTAEMEAYKSKYNAAESRLADFIKQNEDCDQMRSNANKEECK